jgi:hypothetical protein
MGTKKSPRALALRPYRKISDFGSPVSVLETDFGAKFSTKGKYHSTAIAFKFHGARMWN